jgi:YVTN family beta-propeller protein
MRYFSAIVILTTALLSGCKKEDPNPAGGGTQILDNGILVLCEGLFQNNNATVSWLQLPEGTHIANFFETKTTRALGDTGNDMKRYGGKIYIVVNVSSTIEVMRASDFIPLQQIEMISNGQPKQPRSIAFANGNAYVTCFDGFVDVIDTTTLTVTERIAVGPNPEGIDAANNKLYVANSGGLNFPNVDSTISVIDLNTNTELQRIAVGPNPGAVMANDAGDVFVISRGDYGSIPARLRKIDSSTDQVVNNGYNFDIVGMSAMNNTGMIVYDASGIHRFNYATDAIEYTFPIDMSGVTTLYGIGYESSSDRLYVLDAMGYTNLGYVRMYSSSGSLISNYQVGLNPNRILFFN